MTAATIHSISAMAEQAGAKSATVKAIGKCLAGYKRCHDAEIEKGSSSAWAHRQAKTAYKIHMPPLDGGTEAIKAYIGCIAQGINLEVFSGRDGSQLLYAAQVALTLAGREADANRETKNR